MKRGKASILPVLFVLITAMLCPGPAFAVSAQSLPDGDSPSVQETAASPSAPESSPESSVPASSQPPLPDVPPQESTEPSSEPVPQESTAAPTNPEDVSLPETPSEPALSPTFPSVDAPSQAPESPEEGSPAESQESAPLTVAQALALPAGSTSVTVRGIVVFTEGPQIVIQDDTGGMRVSFSLAAPLNAGDLVTITGRPIGSFFGESWTVEGTAPLPAVSSTLAQAPENLRVTLSQVTLGEGVLLQDGYSLPYSSSVPVSASPGATVNVWGVVIDQQFYADTIQVVEDSKGPSAEVPLPNIYFGLLHGHTQVSDGVGTVSQAFASAAQVPGLDFYGITDHSGAFDNAASGSIVTDGSSLSQAWTEGKAAAAAVTDETFVGIYGYEMTWPTDAVLGHINTFCTPGWEAVTQEPFPTLEEYYTALTQVPQSVSQFNHPDKTGYGDFESFSHYLPSYDQVIHLLEVGWDGEIQGESAYIQALDQGWHLAPSASQNNHAGDWGTSDTLRTAIAADTLTEESLFEAIRQRRVYATEDSDLSIGYWVNGNLMGSILSQADTLTAQIMMDDPTDHGPAQVEVIADGGVVVAQSVFQEEPLTLSLPAGYTYYFLRITQEDGDTALTAPVWTETYQDVGISDFQADSQQVCSGVPVKLSVTLTNQEWEPFLVESVEFSTSEDLLYHSDVQEPVTDTATFQAQVTLEEPGLTEIQAQITGTIDGQARCYQDQLSLYCQPGQQSISQLAIAEARQAVAGTCLKIQGYVTAGTANPNTAFPGTLYLQDGTGGIMVTGVTQSDIQIGSPLAVTGVLCRENGVPTLELTECSLLQEEFYRYVPKTLSIETAMNYQVHGDELMQLEGTVVSVEYTSDGEGVRRFVLQDIRGDRATVEIPSFILSGAYGVNQLADQVRSGEVVRVMGFCTLNQAGETVLRVRNCDEVVQVPPDPDPSNPKTADPLLEAMGF